jgi:hypothetical protein
MYCFGRKIEQDKAKGLASTTSVYGARHVLHEQFVITDPWMQNE